MDHHHSHANHQNTESITAAFDPLTIGGMATNFGLSLVTSLHCAAMCGPLVIALLTKKRTMQFSHVAMYNFGRGVSYCTAGLMFGSITERFAKIVPQLGSLMAAFASIVIVYMGFKIWFPNMLKIPQLGLFHAIVSKTLVKVQRWPNLLQAFLLGLFTIMLPCMTLAPALAASIGTRSAIGGLAYMFSFFLGTLPIMLITPLLPNAVRLTMRPNIERIFVTVFLACSALITILRAFPAVHHYLH